MKSLISVVAIALSGMAAPVLAQDLATMACADYAAQDNAGQMAMMAELELDEQSDGVEPGDVVSGTQREAECRLHRQPGHARLRRLEEDQRHVEVAARIGGGCRRSLAAEHRCRTFVTPQPAVSGWSDADRVIVKEGGESVNASNVIEI